MKPSDLMLTPMFLGWKRSLEDGLKKMSPATFVAALNEAAGQPDGTDQELQDALLHLWFRLVRAERDRRQGGNRPLD